MKKVALLACLLFLFSCKKEGEETGKYSAAGDALWTEGALLTDSVYRFKGQSAAGIVLTEVDFETFDDKARHQLFVGLTRAQLAVEVVLTEQAAGCLNRVV